MQKVTVKAPAKLNLALDVTGFAANGYHTVDMIMQAIGLFETVEIVKSHGYSLCIPGSLVPADEHNTATKAASLFFKETGLLAGADITIHKAIPTRAGMAGGSADAAAVLVGLNYLYNAKLSTQELCKLGLQIGADVPFSILGGTARATGIGDILTPISPLQNCWFAIGMPAGGVSTPAAYKLYDQLGSPFRPDISLAVSALKENDLIKLAANMHNALEYSNGTEETKKIRTLLDEAGAVASMMTGSGAAVFGLFNTKKEAEKAAKQLSLLVPQVFVAPPVTTGPEIVHFS